MRTPNPFRGLGIALVTPFTPSGDVDYPALRALVEEDIAAGADFLCVLGTTAETPTLSAEERAAIMQTVREVNAARVPLIVGCGSNCTADVCRYLTTADLAGYDGVLIVTPYYNKPTQEGLYQHYKAIAEASPLPVVLYNVPSRTGINLEASTTLRIAADCDNVVAVKEASGRIQQIEDIVAAAPEGFEVISGDDAITLELLTVGAVGVISVIGNAYPLDFGEMVHAALAGDYTEALALHRSFSDLYKLMGVEGNPVGIKCLLSEMEKIGPTHRLPLVPASAGTRERIREAMKA